jgi:hypothetical protein
MADQPTTKKPFFKRTWVLVVAALFVGGIIANAANPKTTTDTPTFDNAQVEESQEPVEETQEPVEETPEPVVTEEPVVQTFKMPNFYGMNLQTAQDTLQSLGSYALNQEDASGLGRFQINDSNWKVCRQDPAAGSHPNVDDVITLWSVKLAESCS